jgi:hypothetical protein
MDKETLERLSARNQENFERLKLWGRQGNPVTAGADGEALARKFFVAFDLEFEDIDQSPKTFDPALRAAGGKRPDFRLKTGKAGEILFVDAKHASTDTGKVYRISKAEFEKYKCLQAFEAAKNPGSKVDVALIVFPKEGLGTCFAMMWLDYFVGATECTVLEEVSGKKVQVPGLEVQISEVLVDSKTGEPWTGKMAFV